MDERGIALAITARLGEQPSQIAAITDADDYVICRVSLSSGPAIFKSAHHGSIGVESWAYRTAAELGVPVPRVLAVDLSRTLLPLDFFLVEEVQGIALSDLWSFPDEAPPAELRPLLTKVGSYAARLHSMRLDGFGRCDEDNFRTTGTIRGRDASWRTALLAEAQRDLVGLASAGVVDNGLVVSVQEVMASFGPALEQFGDARLLHGDLQVYHVLVDPAEASVRAFIDFGEVGAGDPVWDLALFSVWEEDALQYFLDGYAPDEARARQFVEYGPFYRLVRMVSIAAWFQAQGDRLRMLRAVERVRTCLAAITV